MDSNTAIVLLAAIGVIYYLGKMWIGSRSKSN